MMLWLFAIILVVAVLVVYACAITIDKGGPF